MPTMLDLDQYTVPTRSPAATLSLARALLSAAPTRPPQSLAPCSDEGPQAFEAATPCSPKDPKASSSTPRAPRYPAASIFDAALTSRSSAGCP